MARYFSSPVVGLILVGVLGCGGSTDHLTLTWTEYRDPEGAFTVLMPAAVTAQRATNASPAGEIVSASHVATAQPAIFTVSYEDYPQQFAQELGGALLEAALKSNRRSGAILLSQSPTTLAGHPAIEYEVQEQTDQHRILKGRLMQLNNRMYDVFVDAPSGIVADEDIAKFLNSFQVTSK